MDKVCDSSNDSNSDLEWKPVNVSNNMDSTTTASISPFSSGLIRFLQRVQINFPALWAGTSGPFKVHQPRDRDGASHCHGADLCTGLRVTWHLQELLAAPADTRARRGTVKVGLEQGMEVKVETPQSHLGT